MGTEVGRAFWTKIQGPKVEQGEYFSDVPVLVADSMPPAQAAEVEKMGAITGEVQLAHLIVLTQSCDLENGKVLNALCAKVDSIADFKKHNHGLTYDKPTTWQPVKDGRVLSLFMLPSPEPGPDFYHRFVVVDFRNLITLPLGHLLNFASSRSRWRLGYEYNSEMVQRFARFITRPALPQPLVPDLKSIKGLGPI